MTEKQFNYYATETKTLIKSSNRWTTVHLFEDEARRDEWVARKAKPRRNNADAMTTQRQAVSSEQAADEIANMNMRSTFEGGVIKHTFSPRTPKAKGKKPAGSESDKEDVTAKEPPRPRKARSESIFNRWPFLKANFEVPENEGIDPDLLQSNARIAVKWLCDGCGETFERTVRAQATRARKGTDTAGDVTCKKCGYAAARQSRNASRRLS